MVCVRISLYHVQYYIVYAFNASSLHSSQQNFVSITISDLLMGVGDVVTYRRHQMQPFDNRIEVASGLEGDRYKHLDLCPTRMFPKLSHLCILLLVRS